VRYAPHIAVALAGFALAIAGALSLGIGAVYGGVALVGLPAVIAFARHELDDAAHEEPVETHQHHGTAAAT
jgi:hypothetical protein